MRSSTLALLALAGASSTLALSHQQLPAAHQGMARRIRRGPTPPLAVRAANTTDEDVEEVNRSTQTYKTTAVWYAQTGGYSACHTYFKYVPFTSLFSRLCYCFGCSGVCFERGRDGTLWGETAANSGTRRIGGFSASDACGHSTTTGSYSMHKRHHTPSYSHRHQKNKGLSSLVHDPPFHRSRPRENRFAHETFENPSTATPKPSLLFLFLCTLMSTRSLDTVDNKSSLQTLKPAPREFSLAHAFRSTPPDLPLTFLPPCYNSQCHRHCWRCFMGRRLLHLHQVGLLCLGRRSRRWRTRNHF